MRVAALGRTEALYESILEVRRRGHEIVLIATSPAAPEYTRTDRDFADLAAELGCPFVCHPRLDTPEALGKIDAAGADVAISINWLTLIPGHVLRRFPRGVVNAHFGDLPRYRGNACPNWAILAGEERAVLTLHEMEEALDAGPILLQRSAGIGADTYVGELYRFAGENLPPMFGEVLDLMQSGALTPRAQSRLPHDALRCLPRTPADGLLDWSRSAILLDRVVRASAEPFAGAFAFLGDERITVWRAHSAPLPYPVLGVPGQVFEVRRGDGTVAILTGDGLLVLEEVQREGRVREAASASLTSTRLRLTSDPAAAEVLRLRRRVAELERGMASGAVSAVPHDGEGAPPAGPRSPDR